MAALLPTTIPAWLALAAAAAPLGGQPPPASTNLVPNPGFEVLEDGFPAGWRPITWSGEAEFSVVEGEGRGGSRCVRIASSTGADASIGIEIEVEPDTDYRLSAWIRTRGVESGSGLGAQLNLHQLQKSGKTDALTGTSDWTLVESTFHSGPHRRLLLNTLLGGWGRSTGEAWFDDVSVVDLTPPLPDLTEEGKVAFFEERVLPILRDNCFRCHATEEPEGGLYLGSRLGVAMGGDAGPAIDLARPKESLLLRAVRYETLQMPPDRRLSDEEVAALAMWVRLGAPWTEATADELPGALRTKNRGVAIDEKARSHWAFQPIAEPAIPAPADPAWRENPIDAFLKARMEARGVAPASEASREALIRRATYDLTGLPPTREEVEAFLADTRPDAWERLVDRLLESPHFGEKWARHWLDLVRYAETNSFERDGRKPHVWRYRDYVIRAFIEDKPFSEFLIEQLAGDELDDPSPDAIVATGYYRLGQWDDEPADPLQAEFDGLDDILTTTSQTFLGLTINCARCHDHKLDPIPQRDYYRMLSYFRNVRHYGVRSHESVVDASVRIIASEEERARHRREVEAHEARIARIDQRLRQIEALVLPDFAPVEHDEFKNENARPGLVAKRAGSRIDRETATEYADLADERRRLVHNPPAALSAALVVKERGPEPLTTHVLIRGNPHVPGDPVEPGLPEVLGCDPPPIEPRAESTGRRLALARWMVSEDNPLTARVVANRIWQHHFGRGIVATPNDFGLAGARPTHPELLDWLAGELRRNGWRLKPLHRLILRSRAYRMSSRPSPGALARDPQNELFSRFSMRRLTAEEVRDSTLAVSGSLNLQMFGPSIYPEIPAEVLAGQSRPGEGWHLSPPDQRDRRSIYVHVKRSLALPILAAFDAADTDFPCPVRFATSQPTQALTLLNSAFSEQQARRLVEDLRALAPGLRNRIEEILWRVTQRRPTEAEVERGLRFVTEAKQRDGVSDEEALQTFGLLALNLNEFLYLD